MNINFSNLIAKIARPAGVAARELERHKVYLENPFLDTVDKEAMQAFRRQPDLLFPPNEIMDLQHEAVLRDDVTRAAESFYGKRSPDASWGRPEPNQGRLFPKEFPEGSIQIGYDYDPESYTSEPIYNARPVKSVWERPTPQLIALLRALEGHGGGE